MGGIAPRRTIPIKRCPVYSYTRGIWDYLVVIRCSGGRKVLLGLLGPGKFSEAEPSAGPGSLGSLDTWHGSGRAFGKVAWSKNL